MKRHQNRWFINRIGKIIYRPKIKWCKCELCQRTDVKVGNKQHALYLKLSQDELGVRYQDKLIK